MDQSVLRPAGKPLFFRIAILVGAYGVFLYAFGAVTLVRYGVFTKQFGWSVLRKDHQLHVDKVNPEGAAAGKLQPGDRILSIDGDTRVDRADPRLRARLYPAEVHYSISDARGVAKHVFRLAPRLGHSNQQLANSLSIFVVSLSWFSLA